MTFNNYLFLELIIYCIGIQDSLRNKTFICELSGMQTLTFNYIHLSDPFVGTMTEFIKESSGPHV